MGKNGKCSSKLETQNTLYSDDMRELMEELVASKKRVVCKHYLTRALGVLVLVGLISAELYGLDYFLTKKDQKVMVIGVVAVSTVAVLQYLWDGFVASKEMEAAFSSLKETFLSQLSEEKISQSALNIFANEFKEVDPKWMEEQFHKIEKKWVEEELQKQKNTTMNAKQTQQSRVRKGCAMFSVFGVLVCLIVVLLGDPRENQTPRLASFGIAVSCLLVSQAILWRISTVVSQEIQIEIDTALPKIKFEDIVVEVSKKINLEVSRTMLLKQDQPIDIVVVKPEESKDEKKVTTTTTPITTSTTTTTTTTTSTATTTTGSATSTSTATGSATSTIQGQLQPLLSGFP